MALVCQMVGKGCGRLTALIIFVERIDLSKATILPVLSAVFPLEVMKKDSLSLVERVHTL
jgi:hypothetical protein